MRQTTTSSRNGAVLTTHETTIQTAQVEIRVMKVGKKQVTMGMFRQLPYEQVVDFGDLLTYMRADLSPWPPPDVSLWGHVNYWWPDDYKGDELYTDDFGQWVGRGDKRHVVWEEDASLRRAIICEHIPRWVFETWADAAPLQMVWHQIWQQSICTLPQLFIAV